ncbi:hypothetical protein R70006_06777 [Paraburkholderia domus]|uniref:hypothetical protein n=1 Tax=Paraburkholderia domus TaxID=2793075 RepID=UPI0019112846|nr:hypothetical protein [Paraburkholderia domus]MBK5053358.1 hypothetical protein [Burkholderia sp. R-70006]CAE6823026.1 hypothetical protein R75483_06334 [Paraburkholderia domus]CAE6833821.1 hypothetical protein R70006_06777 [Paraburkholderia domus]
MQLKHARLLFYVAAVFNFAAVVLLHPASGMAAILGLSPAPGSGVFDQIALLAIFAFGVGYWLVARNPERNRDLVKIALAAKLGVVAIIVAHFLADSANARLVLLVSGDLLFSLAFLYFLTARASQAVRA